MAVKKWVGTNAGNEGDWATAANWSPAGVPVNADDVYLENSNQSVTEGFAQSAVTLASLNIAQSYTGTIGDSSDYLAISATILNIGHHYGVGSPAGSGRIKINLGSNASTITVFNTASVSTDLYYPAVRLLNVHAASVLTVRKGTVGLAYETSEVSTVLTINVGYVDNIKNDAKVYVGSGVSLTNYTQDGGDNLLGCAATTVTAKGGLLLTEGSGAVTTLNTKGADITSNSTGTITTLNLTAGMVDFLKNMAARTVTTLKLEADGTLKYDPDSLTITNKVDSDNKVVLRASAA